MAGGRYVIIKNVTAQVRTYLDTLKIGNRFASWNGDYCCCGNAPSAEIVQHKIGYIFAKLRGDTQN